MQNRLTLGGHSFPALHHMYVLIPAGMFVIVCTYKHGTYASTKCSVRRIYSNRAVVPGSAWKLAPFDFISVTFAGSDDCMYLDM